MTLGSLTKLLKKYDSNFFAKVGGDGITRVFCNAYVLRELEGENIVVSCKEPYHVFSLTETWGFHGKRADWGYLPVMYKLSEISLANRDRILREVEESEKRAEERKNRKRDSMTNDIAHEMHSVMKHGLKDVLTHSLENNDSRYINDKKIRGI